MKKKLVLLLIFFGLTTSPYCQQLAAFNDYMGRFWVFDGGMFTQLEYLEIQNFQVGAFLVAYIDNGGYLNVYRNGKVEQLITGSPIYYSATDYLLGYAQYEQLNVYDNGEKKVLSMQCAGFEFRDSLIAWYDHIDQKINVYYNGKTHLLEDRLIQNPLGEYRLGDNTIVYVNTSTRQLLLFYQGEIIVLDDFAENATFETGRDIVAFIDTYDQEFKVFYNREEIILENFVPKSFKVGDEIMAYVDNLGRFKYFENGEVTEILSYEPGFYDVVDRVIVFADQGFLKTICNQQVYLVERYIPQLYLIDFNTIAYLDQSSFVKTFQNCESVTISFQRVKEINLIRDLIVFVENINETNIYFLGQVFKP